MPKTNKVSGYVVEISCFIPADHGDEAALKQAQGILAGALIEFTGNGFRAKRKFEASKRDPMDWPIPAHPAG